jgi:hypothetical protein
LKKLFRLRAIKILDVTEEVLDFSMPIIGYAKRKLLKRSGEKHKKQFKRTLDKYDIE